MKMNSFMNFSLLLALTTFVNVLASDVKNLNSSLLWKKGNELFGEKKFLEADLHFEKCLHFSQFDGDHRALNKIHSILWSNRAQCMLNLKIYIRAHDFAVNALKLDHTNEKAKFRKQKAIDFMIESMPLFGGRMSVGGGNQTIYAKSAKQAIINAVFDFINLKQIPGKSDIKSWQQIKQQLAESRYSMALKSGQMCMKVK